MQFTSHSVVAWRRRFLAFAAVGLVSCGAPSGPASSARSADTIAPRSITQIEPPRTLRESGLALGSSADHAKRTKDLDAVLASLSRPEGLPPAASPEAEPDTPSVEAQLAFAAGRVALRSGARFEARRRFEQALRLAPAQPAVLRSLGRLYASVGNLDRSAEYLRRAVAADPFDTESLHLLGRAAAAEGRHAAAAAFFHAVIERIDQDPRGDPALPIVSRYRLAAALEKLGYAAAAVTQLEAFLDAPRDSPYFSYAVGELRGLDRRRERHHHALGDLYLQLDRPADAAAAYSRAEHLGSLDPDLAARRVYAELLAGNLAEARRVALALFEQPERRDQAVSLLAYLTRHDPDGASLLDAVTEAYAAGGRDAATAIALAELLPPDRATALLREHLGHRPDDTAVLIRLVRLSLEQGGAGEAVRAVAPLIEAFPDRSPRLVDVFFEIVGDPARVADARPATLDEAENPAASALLHGVAEARLGDLDEAQALLQRAFDAQATLLAARLALAELSASRGGFETALELLSPVTAASPAEAVIVKVEVLRELGRNDEAFALLERSRLRSSDADLALLQSELLIAADRPDDAERVLQDALNANPKAEAIYARLFRLYDSENPPEDAVTRYQRLLRRVLRELPESRTARYKLGELHLVGGRLGEAEQQLLPLVRADPGDAEAIEMLLQVYVKAKRIDGGVESLESALDQRPQDEALLTLALAFYRQTNQADKAAEVGQRLLELRPPGPERDRALALLLLESGRLDEARPLVEGLIDRHGDDADNLRLAVRFFEAVGDEARALEATEGLLKLQPPGPQRDRALALVYLRLDRPGEAAPLLERLLAAENTERGDLVASLLWQAYFDLDRPGDALAALNQAIERFPAHRAELLYQRSVLHSRLRDEPAAEAALKAALEADADHPASNNALAYQWAVQNRNLTEALAMARRAVRAESENAAYLDTLGWVLYKRGDFEAASGWLTRASRGRGGDYPIIFDHLGDALFRAGRVDPATRAWERALELLRSRDWDSHDPELEGLDARLESKLEAVEAGRRPATAIVPAAEAA